MKSSDIAVLVSISEMESISEQSGAVLGLVARCLSGKALPSITLGLLVRGSLATPGREISL